MLEATWGNTIIELDRPDEQIGCLVLPDRLKEQKLTGTVKSVGPGVVDIQGRFKAPSVKPGDRVVMGRHLGYSVPHQGKKFYLIQNKFIEAVFSGHEHNLPDYLETVRTSGKFYEYLYVDLPTDDPAIVDYKEAGWGVFSSYKKAGQPYVLRLFRPAQGSTLNDYEDYAKDHVVPSFGSEAKYEYMEALIYAHRSEPEGPEFKQLESLKKDGWEPDQFTDSPSLLLVSRLRRKV